MALSSSARDELTKEYDLLQIERDAIDQRMAAIQVILGTKAHAPLTITLPTPLSLTESAQRVREQTSDLLDAIEAPGLRQFVMNIINEQAPVAPGEIVATVKRSNFRHRGKTPIETRVYNIVGRAFREGKLRRDQEGRYSTAG